MLSHKRYEIIVIFSYLLMFSMSLLFNALSVITSEITSHYDALHKWRFG